MFDAQEDVGKIPLLILGVSGILFMVGLLVWGLTN